MISFSYLTSVFILYSCQCHSVYTYICVYVYNTGKTWWNWWVGPFKVQVQIVNSLSILSLESSVDAQSNWFMHTIKVFVLQKFTVFFVLFFFKPENVSEKRRWMWDIFQSCSSSQKINSFKMPNNNNRHLKWYLKDRFSVPKHYIGRERCFCYCYNLYLNE